MGKLATQVDVKLNTFKLVWREESARTTTGSEPVVGITPAAKEEEKKKSAD